MKKQICIISVCLFLLAGCSMNVPEVQQTNTVPTVPQVKATNEAVVAGVVDIRDIDLNEYSKEVLVLLNEYRTQNNLNELKWDTTLAEVAAIRAPELVQKWSHIRPNGTKYVDILDEIRYPSPLVGENLGRYQTTPEEVMQMWIESPGHNANLLGDFTKVGISVYEENGLLYWVQIFAK